VAISVQFQHVATFKTTDLGLIWEKFRDRFPRTEQQPPLPHIVERKGVRPMPPQVEFSVVSATEHVPRVWMVNEADTELIQIQPDHFVRNWRRHHDRAIGYPSFDALRPGFVRDLEIFLDFARAEKWSPIVPDQCEVTYINRIDPCRVWSRHSELGKVFRGWSEGYPQLVGTAPEALQVSTKHELTDSRGEFLGRLFLDITSAFARDAPESPIFMFQLCARGRPLGDGFDGVMRFIDLGHEAIVNSFAEVTTNEMHREWERIQ
jgi:uncharacterized protein (TIGR04255 family)